MSHDIPQSRLDRTKKLLRPALVAFEWRLNLGQMSCEVTQHERSGQRETSRIATLVDGGVVKDLGLVFGVLGSVGATGRRVLVGDVCLEMHADGVGAARPFASVPVACAPMAVIDLACLSIRIKLAVRSPWHVEMIGQCMFPQFFSGEAMFPALLSWPDAPRAA